MGIKYNLVSKMLKKWEERDNKILSVLTLPDGITENRDVPYIDDGLSGHLLDVYYPEEVTEKLPVIVDIHGGGYVYGSKEMNRAYGYRLAQRGFVVFNLNYRLALEDTKVPGQIQDIAAALGWIGEHLRAYPAQEGPICLLGESAGGALAIMAALIAKSARLRQLFHCPEIRLQIGAAAVNCGMMNLEDKRLGFWGLRSMCLERGYQKQEYYQNLIFVNIPEMRGLPPVFLTTCDEDELREMTLQFGNTLREYHVPHEMKYFPKIEKHRLGHMFSVFYPDYPESAELMDAMLGFFRSHALPGADGQNAV